MCCWLRLPKLLLSAKILLSGDQNPAKSKGSSSRKLIRLANTVFSVAHVCACVWFYIGTQYQVIFIHFALHVMMRSETLISSVLVSWQRRELVYRGNCFNQCLLHRSQQVRNARRGDCLGAVLALLLLECRNLDLQRVKPPECTIV